MSDDLRTVLRDAAGPRSTLLDLPAVVARGRRLRRRRRALTALPVVGAAVAVAVIALGAGLPDRDVSQVPAVQPTPIPGLSGWPAGDAANACVDPGMDVHIGVAAVPDAPAVLQICWSDGVLTDLSGPDAEPLLTELARPSVTPPPGAACPAIGYGASPPLLATLHGGSQWWIDVPVSGCRPRSPELDAVLWTARAERMTEASIDGCPRPTVHHSGPEPGWGDFVRTNGQTYNRALGAAWGPSGDLTVSKSDTGALLGAVRCQIADDVTPVDYEPVNGDASLLPQGTELRALDASADGVERIAALVEGEWYVYEATD